MKKILMSTALLILAVAVSSTAFAHGNGHGHGGHHRFGFVVGPVFHPYNPYPPVYFPPPMFLPPPVYIQQQPAQPAPPPVYWYYCEQSRIYYPYVKECSGGWMKVVPPAPPR